MAPEKEITNLSTLDAEIKAALENNDLKTAGDILDKSKSIVELINIPIITKEWNMIGEDYNERNNNYNLSFYDQIKDYSP